MTPMVRTGLVLMLMVAVFCLCCYGCAAGNVAMIAGGTAAAGGAAYLTVRALDVPISDILHYAGKEAAILSLQEVQKTSPDFAKTAATDTSMACADALAYLNSGELPGAQIVNQVITGYFKNLDPVIVSRIQAVAGVLAKYVPPATVVLSPVMVTYIIAFISGIKDGCDAFIANPAVSIKAKYSNAKRAAMPADPNVVPWFYAVEPTPAVNPEAAPCHNCSRGWKHSKYETPKTDNEP